MFSGTLIKNLTPLENWNISNVYNGGMTGMFDGISDTISRPSWYK